MSIELYVIIALTVVAFGIGLTRAFQTMEEARKRVSKAFKAKKAQVDRLRRAGQTSLGLKRALRDAQRRLEITKMDVDEAESQRQAAEVIDHRLFVLDERRTKADQSWVVIVAHSNLAEVNHNAREVAVQSWQAGRRFLVYALDEPKARGKALARYPERLGYRLVSVQPQGAARATKSSPG